MKLSSLLALSALVLATSTVSARVFAGAGAADGPAPSQPKSQPAKSPQAGAESVVSNDSPGTIGTSYCAGVVNSTGLAADLSIAGSAVALDDAVTLNVTDLPQGSWGVFLTSRFAGFIANPRGSAGNACMRRDVGRFVGPGQVKNSGLAGAISLSTTAAEWTTQAIPRSVGTYTALAGTRTHFQLWYRDLVGGVPTSNFSDGEYVDWQ